MGQLRDRGVGMMRTSEQINAFWCLARESSVDGERLRRRIGAIAAMALLVCGFLATIGLGLLVLVFLVGLLISVGVVVFAAAWPQVRTRSTGWMGQLRSHSTRARASLGPTWRRARGASGTAFASARSRASALGRELSRSARSTAIRFAPGPARIDPQGEALRLNAAGTQHRRDGHYDEAVECHRQALEILRELDDRRAVALTQSNLALALSHAGDDDWAIGLFEEAAATLRELGDEEDEARIMANLGVAHRRHGRPDEATNVLQLALTKLSPDSSAYHTIEAELRRAS
jgi:Tetratricopeptide repeat